jgi:hypothetical protein
MPLLYEARFDSFAGFRTPEPSLPGLGARCQLLKTKKEIAKFALRL